MRDVYDRTLADWMQRRSDGLGQDVAAKMLVDSGFHRFAAAEAVGMGVVRSEQGRWSELPSRVDLGDRQGDLVLFSRHPDLALVDGFITEGESDALIEASRTRLSRSQIIDTDAPDGGSVVSASRTSWSMYFERAESPLVRSIEQRAAALAGMDVSCAEPVQVVRYAAGAGVESHQDFFDPQDISTRALVGRGGQRIATVLVYLRAPQSGGETLFSDVQLEFCPRPGAAVLFFYPTASDEDRTLHSSAPVIDGEKWIATVWFREPRCEGDQTESNA